MNSSRLTIIWALSLAVILLPSCNDAQFTEPMPAGKRDLQKFPKEFQGDWTDGETTLWVGERSFCNSDVSDTVQIGGEFHLRRMAGMLVVSFPEDAAEKWTVLLAEIQHSNLVLRSFDPEDELAIAIWREVLGTEGLSHVKTDRVREKKEKAKREQRTREEKRSKRKDFSDKLSRKRTVLTPTKAQFKTLIQRGATTALAELRPSSQASPASPAEASEAKPSSQKQ